MLINIYLFRIFCRYFPDLKAREISHNMWATHKIFVKLHLAQFDNLHLIKQRKTNSEKHIHDPHVFDEYSNDINNVSKYTENNNVRYTK